MLPAFTMVSIIMLVGLGSLRLVAATLITLVFGLILTAAFATFTVGKLNLISVAFAVLYIGVVDAVLSFMRVEGFLPPVFGEELALELGKSQFRGPWVHLPLTGLAFVTAFFTRTLGFQWLALMIVEDGRKDGTLIRIRVDGAETVEAARRIAGTVRESRMIHRMVLQDDKLALGRFVAAVGMAAEKVDQGKLDLRIGGVQTMRDGEFTDGSMVAKAVVLKDDGLDVTIDVGVGEGSATAYTVAV